MAIEAVGSLYFEHSMLKVEPILEQYCTAELTERVFQLPAGPHKCFLKVVNLMFWH